MQTSADDGIEPPYSLEAEREVIADAIQRATAEVLRAAGLEPTHFYWRPHRSIVRAILAIAGEGRAPAHPAILENLARRGELFAADAMADALVKARSLGGATESARVVFSLFESRELLRALERGSAVLRVGRVDAGEGYDQVQRELRLARPVARTEPKPTSRPLVELAREMASAGPRVRLATGIETLDKAMHGGFPVPWLAVLGGAPGAGKTSLALFLANRWARAGVFVGILAVDEGPEGAVMRLAQMAGFKASRLDEADSLEWDLVVEALAELPILIADGDEGATLESVARDVRARAGDRPAVLIADSIQTVRASGTDGADGPRARADRVVAALKLVTRELGLLTVATCELARGSYRSKSAADQINDLAAFKESGSIEYAAQTAIVLRSDVEDGLINAAVPKNRAHRKLPFRLQMDHRTASFVEVPVDLERPTTDAPPTDAQSKSDASLVERLVLESPGVSGMTGLRALVRARGHKLGNVRLDAAVAYLGLSSPASPIESARLEDRPEKGRPRWFVRSVWSVGSEEQACAQ